MCLLYACHPQATGGEERQQAFGSGWVCRSALCVQVAVLMLVHMAGRLSVLHVWTCVCAYLEYVSCPGTKWPVNTEPRLSCANRAGSGGYPWVLNRYHIQLLPTVLFYNHCNEKLLQTSGEELTVLFTKRIWPKWFSERSLIQHLHTLLTVSLLLWGKFSLK